MFIEYIKLLRTHQYIKNLFIFLPLFFSHKFTDIHLVLKTFLAFIAFSFVASSIYILNDIKDIEEDKKHPKKRFRPLASGKIPLKRALFIMLFMGITGFLLMLILSIKASLVLLMYVVLNILYSFYLKHVAILDITIISIGFVIRLFVGSFVGNIPLSIWIVILTFLLAMFLALAKRRDDIIIFEKTGIKLRKVIDGYNKQFLDISMAIMSAVVIVAYILYTIEMSHYSNYLYITSFWVIIGIMRYLQITFVNQNSGSPTEIVLKDKFIQLVLIGWILNFVWILYL